MKVKQKLSVKGEPLQKQRGVRGVKVQRVVKKLSLWRRIGRWFNKVFK